MSHLDKIAGPDAAVVLARSAKVASALADENDGLRVENDQLRAKIASYERRDRVRSLASQMEERGLNADLTFDEKIASIDSYEDLDQIEQAIKMAGAGSIDLPSVSDQLGRGANPKHSIHAFFATGQSD